MNDEREGDEEQLEEDDDTLVARVLEDLEISRDQRRCLGYS